MKAGHTGGRRGEGGGEGASECETDRESSGEGKKKSWPEERCWEKQVNWANPSTFGAGDSSV